MNKRGIIANFKLAADNAVALDGYIDFLSESNATIFSAAGNDLGILDQRFCPSLLLLDSA